MNGIDISNWQNGINLAAVPFDFVICKATEGTRYVSPDCDRQIQQAVGLGKLVGVYHYVNGGDAEAEAEYFYEHCKGYVGKAASSSTGRSRATRHGATRPTSRPWPSA